MREAFQGAQCSTVCVCVCAACKSEPRPSHRCTARCPQGTAPCRLVWLPRGPMGKTRKQGRHWTPRLSATQHMLHDATLRALPCPGPAPYLESIRQSLEGVTPAKRTQARATEQDGLLRGGQRSPGRLNSSSQRGWGGQQQAAGGRPTHVASGGHSGGSPTLPLTPALVCRSGSAMGMAGSWKDGWLSPARLQQISM